MFILFLQKSLYWPWFLSATQQITLHLSDTLLAQMCADFLLAKKMTVYKL